MIAGRLFPAHRQRKASLPPVRRQANLAPWRFWTAILTAIAFTFLVSTAATHHHKTLIDDQDCAVCSVVSHKLADQPLVVLPKLVAILIAYAPFLPAASCATHVSPFLLPPSCGPPATYQEAV